MGSKLDRLLDEIIGSGLFVGPDAITDAVLSRSNEVDWDEVHRALVLTYVARALTRRRTRNPAHRASERTPVGGAGRTRALPLVRRRAISGGNSAKVTGIRDAAQSWLDEQVAVGDRKWKPLVDCTQEDMTYLIKVRLKMSSSIKEQAERYQGWLELMRQHDVDRLGDLPEEVLNS